MTLTRRFVVVLALMVWQGGFMFYGAVTVPVVRTQLGPGPERSQITQRVTQWMNLIGTVAILAMFVDVKVNGPPNRRGRWAAWIGMAAAQPPLVWLHIRLSTLMAQPGFYLSDQSSIKPWHTAYLTLNAVQWLAGMAFLALSLKAWRDEDREPASGSGQ